MRQKTFLHAERCGPHWGGSCQLFLREYWTWWWSSWEVLKCNWLDTQIIRVKSRDIGLWLQFWKFTKRREVQPKLKELWIKGILTYEAKGVQKRLNYHTMTADLIILKMVLTAHLIFKNVDQIPSAGAWFFWARYFVSNKAMGWQAHVATIHHSQFCPQI